MAQVEIKLEDSKWRLFLDGLRDKSRLRRGLKTVARIVMYKEAIQHFKDESGPQEKWRPRSRATQAAYARMHSGRTTKASRLRDGTEKQAGSPYAISRGASRAQFNPTNKLLQMTGHMRKAFSPNYVREIDAGVVLFNAAEYSGFHDEGTDRLPQREFMWLSEGGIDLAGKMMLEFMKGER